MTTVTILPINPTQLAQVRATGIDALDRPAEWFTDENGGNQLRCCLTKSLPGERIGVISYGPLNVNRPWAEVGPVFIHADDCPVTKSEPEFPEWLDHSPRVLRAYDASGAMLYPANRIVEAGEGVHAALTEMLSDEGVAEVHIRNLLEQCFIARAVRSV